MHKRSISDGSNTKKPAAAAASAPLTHNHTTNHNNSAYKRHSRRRYSNLHPAGLSSSTMFACCALAAFVCLTIQVSIHLETDRKLILPLPDFLLPSEALPEEISNTNIQPTSPPPTTRVLPDMAGTQTNEILSHPNKDDTEESAAIETQSIPASVKSPYQPRVIRLESTWKEFPLPNLRSAAALPPDDSSEELVLNRPENPPLTADTDQNNQPLLSLTTTGNSTNDVDDEDAAVEDKDGIQQNAGSESDDIHQAGDDDDECVPMAKWQSSVPVNCNALHEVDIMTSIVNAGGRNKKKESWSSKHHRHHHNSTTPVGLAHHIHHEPLRHSAWNESQIKFLGQGWFRAAWKLDRQPPGHVGEDEEDGTDETVILKMLRPERDFTAEFYELHRIDAVAMEQLTHSKFVLNVYGYCGQSALNEFANFRIPELSSLEKFDRQLRGKVHPRISRMKLKLAVSVATGVAHMHELPADLVGHQRPTMAHYDLNPRNVAIVSGGRPKLNDFNVAHFLKWNPRTNQTCGFESRLHEPWWRAPEEVSLNETGPLTNAIDIYSLGNLLFHILTTHSPRGKMKDFRMEAVRQDVLKGIPPPLPKEYASSKDTASKAIRKAMDMCFANNPADRATAREIADVLVEAYLKILDDDQAKEEKQHK